MTVTVLYFAKVRSTLGTSRETFPHCNTVADLVDKIVLAHPAISEMLKICAFSVNEVYVDTTQSLKDGDVVGIIPPVAGG